MPYFDIPLNLINFLASSFADSIQDEFGDRIFHEIIQIMINIVLSLNEYENTDLKLFMNEYEMLLNEIRMLEPIC